MPVTKVEIKSRQFFAGGESFGEIGPYEQFDGVVHFVVDPDNPANETITDLGLAPRDERGLVNFSSDFRMLQPVDPARGNRRILLDILNRGKALALRNINSAPDVAPGAPLDPGNGFLMREGYTVVWCGWQHDVPDVPGVLRINVPDAMSQDAPDLPPEYWSRCSVSPNPPKDTDGRREGSGRGWVRELQGRWPGVLG